MVEIVSAQQVAVEAMEMDSGCLWVISRINVDFNGPLTTIPKYFGAREHKYLDELLVLLAFLR